MSTMTRGALGVRIDGVDKIAAVQFDAYPAFVGRHLVAFLRTVARTRLIAFARALRVVVDGTTPGAHDVARLGRFASAGEGEPDTWARLLYETQGDLAAMLDAGTIVDASSLLTHSEGVAWAYVVNVDTLTLEVYRGEQLKRGTGRYAAAARAPDKYGFWPVALVKGYSLTALPYDIGEDLTPGVAP